jgi:hypothetical protein
VNDALTTEDVEDRVLRTLAARAEDMAPGDGRAWEGDVLRIVPFPDDHRGRGRGRRLLLAAAVLVVVVGAALVIARPRQHDDDPAAPRDATSNASTTAPPSTTVPPATAPYGIGEFERDGSHLLVQFEPGTPEDGLPPSDMWQLVTAGPNAGWYAALPSAGISELWLVFDDGVVQLRGGTIPRDELLAMGATVSFDVPTGRHTMPAPAGWTTVWAGEPETTEPSGPVPQPVGLGRYVSTTEPAVNYNVIWYEGWDAGNVAPDAEPVQVGDQAAYVGSIAPEADDMLQLWIVYDDGVVELQSAGMSQDDLITAATHVTRPNGTDFTVTPAPGFTPDGH